jgi:hypothetical protein
VSEIRGKAVFAHTCSEPAERQASLARFRKPLGAVKDRHLTAPFPRNLVRG